ncbi:hypothetical protein [uncultured Desulfobacter sp.]|uniref:hypothetical protein n=1 Tax=uncultured Desulfobacter sp. TaxID=240139 RepID=UPI002AA67A0F|nr:hypothetical protein [uncultured Desulfobacter sp.]
MSGRINWTPDLPGPVHTYQTLPARFFSDSPLKPMTAFPAAVKGSSFAGSGGSWTGSITTRRP